MKIALVHDYLKEFGGAERVLLTLHRMFPQAPIYTAFLSPGSSAAAEFKDAKIITSWANQLIRHNNLYSPLRFLTPLIWNSFDFSQYDLVILSSSWFLTKPTNIPKNVKVICYCHTPPRYLYGYRTAIDWQRYLIVRIYGHIISHFLRMYDFNGAQRVDQFIANSQNVARRITKFYRKSSKVVYPPVDVNKIKQMAKKVKKKENFYLVASRISSEKGLPTAMDAVNKLGVKLKIVGEFAGLRWEEYKIKERKSPNIEFLGRVDDEELYKLYAQAKAFLALEQDVDFGMTPVEAMAAGTPVIAYRSGGYLESIIDGKTGIFFDEYNSDSLIAAIKKLNTMKIKNSDCISQAENFSEERFKKEILDFVENHARATRG